MDLISIGYRLVKVYTVDVQQPVSYCSLSKSIPYEPLPSLSTSELLMGLEHWTMASLCCSTASRGLFIHYVQPSGTENPPIYLPDFCGAKGTHNKQHNMWAFSRVPLFVVLKGTPIGTTAILRGSHKKTHPLLFVLKGHPHGPPPELDNTPRAMV